MPKIKVTYRGVSFTVLLTIAFIVLKLCNVINWSWIWILSPIWFPICLAILFIVLFLIIILIKV